MFGMGLPELLIILLLIVVPFWKIFQKAGYSGGLSFLMLIPGLNFLMLLFLAFSKWPVETKLEQQQRGTTETAETSM